MNRAVAWFTENRVAANLLMIVLIFGGLLTLTSIRQEVFPEFSTDLITVSVIYPGAAPQEVEEGVNVRVEEQIQGITGIKKVTSTAAEGSGTVTIEVMTGRDVSAVLDEVKARVDAIDTFPEEIESPIIQEVLVRRQVISVAVSGQASEKTIKRIGERVRDDISALDGITQVDLANARPYEISIEVSEETLRRYGLTFSQVADAVRRASLDLPGGSVKTEGGEILLRTIGQAYRGREFEKIPVIRGRDGRKILLGKIANVRDGFAETDQFARFDGQPSVLVKTYRVGDQSALEIAEKVKEYVEAKKQEMPAGISLTTWQDDSQVLRSRLNLLLKNGFQGLLLVILILALFLRLKLAFWVSLGIPISFLGAFLLLPTLDVSINLISLFALIVVLGIVVDDAIVVGENIYSQYEKGKSGIQAAVDGAVQMVVPVTFAILTTVVAFAPLLAVPGNSGKIFRVLPLVVIPTLLFSLVECLLILPAHLSHGKKNQYKPNKNQRFHLSEFFENRLKFVIQRVYRPSLEFGLRWRYLTVATAITTLFLTSGLVGAGWIKFVFFPDVEADNVMAMLTMPLGTPVETTAQAVRRLEETAQAVRQEIDEDRDQELGSAFRHMMSSIGSQPSQSDGRPRNAGNVAVSASHLAEVNIELAPAEERSISSEEIAERWRERAGDIPDAVELTFSSSLFSAGDPINIQLVAQNMDRLRSAADRLKSMLTKYPGVYDIAHSYMSGKQEIKLDIKPEAQLLGLSQIDLARQVRQAFYGEEAQRIQRGRDDVKVMVRYPQEQRRSIGDLENMRIRTPDGTEVPFSTVARAEIGTGYSTITRVDRQRAINVTADVDLNQGNPNEIIARIEAADLPELLSEYPEIRYTFEGEQREQQDTLAALGRGFLLALFVIYALMAVPLRSYIQPAIIMSAIPFGFVGAVWGHLIMGQNLSILSMFGIVALAGVVVNDNLILVDFINNRRREGASVFEAVREAGVARFRPILLTSLTTFGGLTPLMLETSLQAQFLIPMAISLAFGVVFSTFISLALVPASYLILEDFKRLSARLVSRRDEIEPVTQDA